eukprot:g15840.t1
MYRSLRADAEQLKKEGVPQAAVEQKLHSRHKVLAFAYPTLFFRVVKGEMSEYMFTTAMQIKQRLDSGEITQEQAKDLVVDSAKKHIEGAAPRPRRPDGKGSEQEVNRVYEAATGRFGTTIRSAGILGLKDCKAVAFDDGSKGAFFGKRVSELQLVADGDADVPVDLVGVWKAELKEDHSNRLSRAYLALDAEGQEDVLKRWASTTKRSRAKFEI